jgi:hypothetical protein
MLAAAVTQVRELVESVRKDGRKFKLAYDGLSAAIDEANEAEIKLYRRSSIARGRCSTST